MPCDGYEFNLHTDFPISFRFIRSETNREVIARIGCLQNLLVRPYGVKKCQYFRENRITIIH